MNVCPRCGSITSSTGIAHRGAVCTNPKCSWPNPEPGRITVLRLHLGDAANTALQKLRSRGLWP